MSQQIIDIGNASDDRRGDSPRLAGQKINANFSELYPYFNRNRVVTDVVLYVSTTGNDSNNGLTPGTPFLTVQKGVDVALADYIIPDGKRVTVQLADGTYTLSTAVRFRGPRFGNAIVSSRSLIIQGNVGTPANVIVQCSTNNVFLIYNGFIELQGMELRCTSAGAACVWAEGFSRVSLASMRFGASAAAAAHINLFYNSYCFATSYTVSGSCARHINLNHGSMFRMSSATITFSGAPAFSTTLLQGLLGSVFDLNAVTYSGAITGTQYALTNLSILSSTNTVPGTAGSVSTGSRVISTSYR
jgi:hypothetical protein